MKITPNKERLFPLVEDADLGKVCLPNFQRDYVWDREQVSELLHSIVRGYFIGTLLLLRCDPDSPPFEPQLVRGARANVKKPVPEWLVLDGQQRITSLLYALTAPDFPLKDTRDPRRFFLSIDLLLSDPDNDGVIREVSVRELNGLEKSEEQYAQRLMPFTTLLRTKDFLAWRDGLDDFMKLSGEAKYTQYRETWRTPWTEAMQRVQEFEVATVELPRVSDDDAAGVAEVCAIFEKLNSTGTELSVYDLLTARLYRHRIKLHDLWEDACQQNQRLKAWSEGRADKDRFGVLVLRTVALLRGLEVKASSLVNLKPEGFVKDWHRGAAAVDRALQLLEETNESGFGVFGRKWMPAMALIPPLAALRSEIDQRGLGHAERADLRRWYWSSVFLERYSSAVESTSRRDYVEVMTSWRLLETPAADFEPEVFRDARTRIGFANYTIRQYATQSSSIYRGVFCLLALGGARDWRRLETLTLQDLEDHHIFPKAYLRRHKIIGGRANSLANRTLLSDETNRRIRDLSPAEYISQPQLFPAGEEVLHAHFMTHDAIVNLQSATEKLSASEAQGIYDEFRSKRELEILRRIREVSGVQVTDVPERDSDTDDVEEPTVEARETHLRFWRAFNEAALSNGFRLLLRRPRARHYHTFSLGRSGFHLALTHRWRDQRMGCELYIRHPQSKLAFRLLQGQQPSIERDLGDLDWQPLPGKHATRIVQFRPADLRDEASWPQYLLWGRERVQAFHGAFAPVVADLELGDDEFSDDEASGQ